MERAENRNLNGLRRYSSIILQVSISLPIEYAIISGFFTNNNLNLREIVAGGTALGIDMLLKYILTRKVRSNKVD